MIYSFILVNPLIQISEFLETWDAYATNRQLQDCLKHSL
jgi:hypothetical protein